VRKNRLFLYLSILSLLGIFILFSAFVRNSIKFKYADIGGTSISIDVVDSAALRAKGLSGTARLPLDHGMLFDFKQNGVWAMWMKDMNYPLDMIWITNDGKVVHIVNDLHPSDYPTIHENTTPCRYVLEVNGGVASTLNIGVGSSIHFR
jgi:uncharacterized protein